MNNFVRIAIALFFAATIPLLALFWEMVFMGPSGGGALRQWEAGGRRDMVIVGLAMTGLWAYLLWCFYQSEKRK